MGACYINVQFFTINCCKLFLTALNYTQPTNFVLVALKGEHMKTTIEMAREAAGDDWGLFQEYMPEIHRLVELVRADERGRMCEQCKERSNEKSTSNEANRSAVLGEGG
jgi:hypothetical protein